MWQRFTERARKVVFYAQEEAAKFGEGYVSTEHLLLGIIREPSPTVQLMLDYMKVTPARIRAEVERQLPRGDARNGHDMSLTPRAKRVVDLAYDEARLDNKQNLCDHHLFLGLMREGDGLAGRVLAKLGFELSQCRTIAETVDAVPADSQTYTTTVPISSKIDERAKEIAIKIGQAIGNRAEKDMVLLEIRMAKLEAIEAISDIFDELSLAIDAL
jgi:ATP-dependent Clp protease ATP-binding subunit ClpC